jgi:signal peptidase I
VATETEAVRAQANLFEKASAEDSQPQRPFRERNAAEVAEAIRNRGWAFLKVSGKSMFPSIREDDIIFLRRVAMQGIVRGDVVVFERNNTLCVHRVLSMNPAATAAVNGGALITKGDATADADAPVLPDAFRGKVEFVYRRNRELQIARGWRKYFGRFLAIISPAVPWWRPIAAIGRDAARGELRGVSQIQVRRSSENSAD